MISDAKINKLKVTYTQTVTLWYVYIGISTGHYRFHLLEVFTIKENLSIRDTLQFCPQTSSGAYVGSMQYNTCDTESDPYWKWSILRLEFLNFPIMLIRGEVVDLRVTVYCSVSCQCTQRSLTNFSLSSCRHRLSISRSIPLPVTCGVMVLSCMRYGVWDTNHLRGTPTPRLGAASFVDCYIVEKIIILALKSSNLIPRLHKTVSAWD